MKTKRIQLLRIGILGMGLAAIILTNNLLPKTAFAVGDLTVDWGVTSGDPIFVVNNFAPGECEERAVSVTNSAAFSRQVGVRGVAASDDDSLSSALEITIDKNGITAVYGAGSPTGVKTLENFFNESAGPNALTLSTQTPNESADYNFKVCFAETASNEFQDTSVVFDLIIGLVFPTPDECLEIDFANTIFGTDGNYRIKGTPGNDLIFLLEGNDRADGGGGDDCIVGGSGNDRIEDSTGQDIIFGNDGNDTIDAGSNNDKVFGGTGNDKLEGGSGNDLVFGEEGEDKIYGGAGNDELYGGEDNDLMDGGSGQDQIFGEEGNDNLKGGSDNDFLDGGLGGGNLNGDSGTDTCINWTNKIKCEL